MFKILTSLFKRTKVTEARSRYILQDSTVKRFTDEESGLFRYVRNDFFVDENDKYGKLLKSYCTGPVENGVSYEEAKNKASSFKFDSKKDQQLVKMTHVNYLDDEATNTHSGMYIWNFADGSYVTKRTSFTRRHYKNK